MTLDEVPFGAPARVLDCDALAQRDRDRLDGLGLRPGAPIVKLMRTPLRDPIECLVGSQLLAVEARLLAHIRVETA